MPRGEKLAEPKVINWPAISAWATAGIVASLQESPEFIEAWTLCDQCGFACRLLRESHTPTVPYSFIGKIWESIKERNNIITNDSSQLALPRDVTVVLHWSLKNSEESWFSASGKPISGAYDRLAVTPDAVLD
jgi:hypothetical protein